MDTEPDPDGSVSQAVGTVRENKPTCPAEASGKELLTPLDLYTDKTR